jgi:hypothetical protein
MIFIRNRDINIGIYNINRDIISNRDVNQSQYIGLRIPRKAALSINAWAS